MGTAYVVVIGEEKPIILHSRDVVVDATRTAKRFVVTAPVSGKEMDCILKIRDARAPVMVDCGAVFRALSAVTEIDATRTATGVDVTLTLTEVAVTPPRFATAKVGGPQIAPGETHEQARQRMIAGLSNRQRFAGDSAIYSVEERIHATQAEHRVTHAEPRGRGTREDIRTAALLVSRVAEVDVWGAGGSVLVMYTGTADAEAVREAVEAVIAAGVTLKVIRVGDCGPGAPIGDVATVDPLDVEIDGVTLRDLIERDEIWRTENGRERENGEFVLSRPCFTTAQRAAVSAHWSAQLRAKVASSTADDKERERTRVVLEQDADDLPWRTW